MNRKQIIAQNLRKFGEENFDSMAAFARALEMDPKDLNSYLSARVGVGPKMKKKLDKLGCTEIQLVTGMTKEEIYKRSEESDLRNAEAAAKKRIAELELEIKLLRSYIAPSVLTLVAEQKEKYGKKKTKK